jgi:hypothetical protein
METLNIHEILKYKNVAEYKLKDAAQRIIDEFNRSTGLRVTNIQFAVGERMEISAKENSSTIIKEIKLEIIHVERGPSGFAVIEIK